MNVPELRIEFEREHVFVGTTATRERVLVTGRLERQPRPKDRETVTHGTVHDPLELGRTLVAFTGKKNIGRNLANGVHDESFLTRIVTPAPGFSLAEVRELEGIIRRWHNNALRMTCAHQPDPATLTRDQIDALVGKATCPETGYRYGSKWLVDPLPDEVRDRFVALMSRGEEQEADY